MADETCKLTVAVTSEIATMLAEAVASGDDPTEGEALREALRHWIEHRRRHAAAKAGLGRLSML